VGQTDAICPEKRHKPPTYCDDWSEPDAKLREMSLGWDLISISRMRPSECRGSLERLALTRGEREAVMMVLNNPAL